jgi:hypothetical protein
VWEDQQVLKANLGSAWVFKDGSAKGGWCRGVWGPG